MVVAGMGRMARQLSSVLVAVACAGTTTLSIQRHALTMPCNDWVAGGLKIGGGGGIALAGRCIADHGSGQDQGHTVFWQLDPEWFGLLKISGFGTTKIGKACWVGR
jgi:hypothetical protein